MTNLLIFIVLILLCITVWQMKKVFNLAQMGVPRKDSQVANDKDNSTNGYLMVGFLIFIYALTFYCFIEWGDLPLMNNSASEHGDQIDNLMIISFIMIFAVQFVTQALLHYFAYKYRGAEGRKALYFADSNRLEAIWTIIPIIALSILILYGLYTWNNIMFVDEADEEDAIYVELYAKQFSWEARYAGKDNTLGKSNVRYIEGMNTVGVDPADPNAQDDILVRELHLPKGKRVIFKIRSQDVLHSVYMPHFRAQMNSVPGMVTQFSFIPSMTTQEMRETPEMVEKVANINNIRAKKSAELAKSNQEALDPYEFDYLLLCNKICGASHYNMQMKVIVETEEEFNRWLAQQPTMGTVLNPVKEPETAPEAEEIVVDSTAVAFEK
ncbi:MAG: cytochrome c oxidase subunit II [Flavobacteriaceae bacterium]